MNPHFEQTSEALTRLDVWIEQEGFKGWDPFDALNSPLLKRLTFGNRLLGIIWVQLFKRSPLNLRPVLRIAKGYNPKGMGLFLASYLRKYQITGDPQHLDRVRFFSDWLQRNTSPGYSGACWGYNFDWPNRGYFAPANTPTIVNTAFIGLAFLDAHQLGNQLGSGRSALALNLQPFSFQTPLAVARSACEFIKNDLNTSRPAVDEVCFSYTPLDSRCVHNANVLGACLLAEVACRTGEIGLADLALAAGRYTARRQLSNGAWKYGEERRYGWVDNFHTGYVLVALRRIARCLGTTEFDEAIQRGYGYWKATMFLEDGTPKHYAGRVYPVDSHCVAQAILTFLEFSDHDPEAVEWAWRVATWGIENMQDRQGYFHYQNHRLYRIRIPYMRWTQAWIQRALTELCWLEAIKSRGSQGVSVHSAEETEVVQ